jgi:nitroimidazol reductase NimA-like FMN-containing flavoprotein (pyridoxamine 5'-phosphate oxidase superfamily)
VRRTERAIVEPQELDGILSRGKYAVLAMCRNEEPYVVTMNYGYDKAKGALYFHCAHEGQKLDFVRSNPQVCGTVVEDLGYVQGECAHAYQSVVLRGVMRVVEEAAEKRQAMDVLLHHLEEDPEPVRQGSLADSGAYDRVAILRLDIHDITGKRGR